MSTRAINFIVGFSLTAALLVLFGSYAFAQEAAAGTILDFKPVVQDLIALVFTVLSAFAAFAMQRWASKTKILKDASIRNALLGGIDLALSRAQAMTDTYIGNKNIDIKVKNQILGLAGKLALDSYPQYSKYLKLDKAKVEGILERRWGEIEQAKVAGVAAPPADPSVGASNAAPGLPSA